MGAKRNKATASSSAKLCTAAGAGADSSASSAGDGASAAQPLIPEDIDPKLLGLNAASLHEALNAAVSSRRLFATRCACTAKIMHDELQHAELHAEQQISKERTAMQHILEAAEARVNAAEARTTAIAARAVAERRIFADELGISERRVVRLCHRLHRSMSTSTVYYAELKKQQRLMRQQQEEEQRRKHVRAELPLLS